MRPTIVIPLLALAVTSPAAAQGIALPLRCGESCPRTLALDSVRVWANVNLHSRATTYVDHVIRNTSADSVEGAFFFPVPQDAEVERAWVQDAQRKLETYNEWTRPEESRLMLDGLTRERPGAGLAAYARARVVHVRIPPIAPGDVKHVQIGYVQTLRPERGAIAWRYPLSLAAAASPIGDLRLGMEIRTAAGFADLRSPSHAVRVELGMEQGPCGPMERCGTRGYPSHRVKVVRLEPSANARRRDFELVYTLAPPGTVRPVLEEP